MILFGEKKSLRVESTRKTTDFFGAIGDGNVSVLKCLLFGEFFAGSTDCE